MLIQKWVNKKYVIKYLEKRRSNQEKDKQIMKKFSEKYKINIKWGIILDLAWWPWIDTNIFCQLWAKKVIYHDKYQKYINIAKKINKKTNIEFHKWDINKIDYIQDNSLDFVYCNVSFYYSKNDISLLNKICKKIKKWWYIYIITLDTKKFRNLSFMKVFLFSLFHLIYLITSYKILTLPYNNISKLRKKAKDIGMKEKYYYQPNTYYKKKDAWTGITYILWKK